MKPRLIAFLNAYTQGISGGDIRFIEVARRMKGFKLTVVTSALGRRLCESRGLVAEYVVTTNEERQKNVALTYLARMAKLLGVRLNVGSDDVLYSTSDYLPDVLPAFAHRTRSRGNRRWIAVIHHRYDVPWRRRAARLASVLGYVSQRISFRFIAARADAIFLMKSLEGEEIREMFVRRGFRGKTYLVENGVDIQFVRQVPAEEKRFDACFVASLRRSKGVLDLVEIWRHVCLKRAGARLVVVGSGEEELVMEVKNLVGQYGLSANTVLAGFVPEKEKFELLKASRVFVSPSYEEGWGIAVCEAMACGVPVVAWELPAYKEIYPKGLAPVPVGDIEGFADAVVRILSDEDLYRQMSSDCLEIASLYDWERIAAKEVEYVESLYDN